MRSSAGLWAVFLAVGNLLSQAPATKSARVEGRLVDADTGEGIRKGWLTLRAAGAGATGYTAVSDSHGDFLFEDIDPGRYSLFAEHANYLRSTSAQQIAVNAGEIVKAGRIALTAQGVISGRVLDEDGDPLPSGVQVQVSRWRWDQQTGRRTITQIKQTSADDQGNFRLSGLGSGSYYLSAYGGRTTAAFDDRTVMRGSEAYTITYYPNSPGPAGASTIAVTAGGDIRDINLRLRKTRVARIRGTARDVSTGDPANQVALHLVPLGVYPTSPTTNDAVAVVQNGSFEFPRVTPGSYAILVPDNPAHMVGRYDLIVAEGDIQGVLLSVGPGAAIESRFRMESNEPVAASVGFSLLSADGAGVNLTAKADGKDAPLRVTAIPPGRYWGDVRTDPRSPNDYVKSIRFGEVDATAKPIEILSGSQPPLEVLISANGGTVSGTVRNEKGDPAAATQVILAPVSPELGAVRRLVKVVAASQGSFRFTGVAPGDYLLLALEGGDAGALRDPDFRAAIADKGVKVTVKEGSMLALDVPLIPEKTTVAAMEKLP
jgi:hypothetical protein